MTPRREAWPLVNYRSVAGVTILTDFQTGRQYDVTQVLGPEDIGQFSLGLRGSSSERCALYGGRKYAEE